MMHKKCWHKICNIFIVVYVYILFITISVCYTICEIVFRDLTFFIRTKFKCIKCICPSRLQRSPSNHLSASSQIFVKEQLYILNFVMVRLSGKESWP